MKRVGTVTDDNDSYMRVFWSCFMIEWYGSLQALPTSSYCVD